MVTEAKIFKSRNQYRLIDFNIDNLYFYDTAYRIFTGHKNHVNSKSKILLCLFIAAPIMAHSKTNVIEHSTSPNVTILKTNCSNIPF